MLVENSFILGLIFPYQTADQHINNGIKKADVHHAQIIKYIQSVPGGMCQTLGGCSLC